MTRRQLMRQASDEIKQAERLIEVAVVAVRLRKCQETIRRYIRSGHLKATRLPGHTRAGSYLITESAIADFLAMQHCHTSADITPRKTVQPR